jgi:hypothetical protein
MAAREYENPSEPTPVMLAERAGRLYARWRKAYKRATRAEQASASQRKQDELDLKAAEAYTAFEDARTDLAEAVENFWNADAARSNPFFFFFGLFGGDKSKRRSSAQKARREYYVDYQDPAGYWNQLIIKAASKVGAKAKAKEGLSDRYATFGGGHWEITPVD